MSSVATGDALPTTDMSIAEALRRIWPEIPIAPSSALPLDCATGRFANVAAVVRPCDHQQVARTLKTAHALGMQVHPISTGRNWGYGIAGDDAPRLLLDLGAMNRILHFDDVCGIVTIEPGVNQGQLQTFLYEKGAKWVTPITGSSPDCSVLANALERGFGLTPFSDHFGAVRGLSAVLPDGSMYKNAMASAGAEQSALVSRWGLGAYATGLFSQSHLGVVTSLSIALARRHPPHAIVFSIPETELADAVDLLREIRQTMGELAANIKLFSPDYIAAMKGKPVSSTTWMGWINLHADPSVCKAASKRCLRMMRSAGYTGKIVNESREHMLKKIASILPADLAKRFNALASDANTLMDFLRGHASDKGLALAYRGVLPDHAADPARDRKGVLWYAPVLRFDGNAARTLVERCTQVFRKHGMSPTINLTGMDGQSLCSVMCILFEPKSEVAAAEACYHDLFMAGLEQGVMPYRLPACAPRSTGSGEHAAMIDKIRDAIDPHRVMSPYRVL
jgi:4-cresol dehydrogenase (hydroxylating) flavoprotein subunit